MKWSNLAPLRVALLDDHAIIRSGFSSRLSAERDMKVVAVYRTSRELLAGLRDMPVDVLVLDYTLQRDELDGLNLIRLMRIRFPNVRILIYSATESAATISLSLRAGVRGFVGKSQELDELLIAVRTVGNERIYLDKLVALELGHVPGFHESEEADVDVSDGTGSALVSNPLLSPREQEVLRCCMQGMSVSQIALKFIRSRKTISGQKQSAFRKLGITSDIELFKIRSELDD